MRLEWPDEGAVEGVTPRWWVGAGLCRLRERFGFHSDGSREPREVCKQGRAVS